MRIVELTAHQVNIPLRKPIKHASHTRTETENVVVKCVLEDGTVGYGEGVPREYVTGETIDLAIELLKKSELEQQIRPCADFADAVAFAESVSVYRLEKDDRQCQGNAGRCALELAILDAYGKHFGEPVSKVTQLLADDLHEPKEKVQYSGAVTSTKGFKLRLTAWKYRVFGFSQIKLKVGIEGLDDVARLRSLRKRLGSKVDLRIDANEAWSLYDAVRNIRELQPWNITSVEQPLSHKQADSLTQLRQDVDVPIMLDESLCSMIDAKRAADRGYCDLFNIRLSKCGGFIPSLRLAQFAKENGLGYQLGCQVGETALLSAAGRHFAMTVRDIRYLEGSYDKHLVKESLGKEDITFGWGGWAPALTKPGLGVEIDPEAFQRVTRRKETLVG